MVSVRGILERTASQRFVSSHCCLPVYPVFLLPICFSTRAKRSVSGKPSMTLYEQAECCLVLQALNHKGPGLVKILPVLEVARSLASLIAFSSLCPATFCIRMLPEPSTSSSRTNIKILSTAPDKPAEPDTYQVDRKFFRQRLRQKKIFFRLQGRDKDTSYAAPCRFNSYMRLTMLTSAMGLLCEPVASVLSASVGGCCQDWPP